MPQIIKDRVKESSTSIGTGAFALAGAAAGFLAFSAVCANNDTAPYCIVNQSSTEWEVGIGTWTTGGNLARAKVLSSSNANALVNFSAGTKDVFISIPAQIFSFLMSNTADFAGQNVNTAQPFFEAANDTITLLPNMTYTFEGVIEMTRAAGTTSHTIDVLLGGTISVADTSWQAHCRDGAASTTTPIRPYVNHFHALSGGTVSVAATTVNSTSMFIKGMLRTGATGGTLIPQFKYSAAPGGAPTIKRSSYFKITAEGMDTLGSIGPVA